MVDVTAPLCSNLFLLLLLLLLQGPFLFISCVRVCVSVGAGYQQILNKRRDKQTVHVLHFIFVENIPGHRSDHLGVYQGRKQPCSSTTKRERDHRLLSHFATIPPQSNLALPLFATEGGKRDERASTRSQVRAWILSGWRMGCPECLEQELSLNCLPFTLL